IVSWRLAPGTELSEVEQAERWGVSRTPLREALSRLAGEGLAVAGKGRTLVVSGLDRDDVVHLFELREALETQAARLAARRRDAVVFADLRDRFVTDAGAEADPAAQDAYYALVAELDHAIDEAAASPYLRRALAQLRPHVARVRRLAHDNPERLVRAAAEHRLIAGAIADGDPVLAAQATAVHLRAALDHVLVATTGTPTTSTSTPTPTGAAR